MLPKSLSKLGMKAAFRYIEKDPEKNLPKLMEWVDRPAGTGPDSFQEQRERMYRRIREIRAVKPIFAMDFQNDGEYVSGCIAGGRRYFHINANGDVDSCAFIYYSDSDIREKTLLECLQGPMFMAYHDGQPFNENHLRPCPMLENPELLRKMVHGTGARSTDLQSPETVDHLCGKCVSYAACWKPEADRLWTVSEEAKRKKK